MPPHDSAIFLRKPHAPLGVYAVLGNQDRKGNAADVEVQFARAGIRVLENAAVTISAPRGPLQLGRYRRFLDTVLGPGAGAGGHPKKCRRHLLHPFARSVSAFAEKLRSDGGRSHPWRPGAGAFCRVAGSAIALRPALCRRVCPRRSKTPVCQHRNRHQHLSGAPWCSARNIASAPTIAAHCGWTDASLKTLHFPPALRTHAHGRPPICLCDENIHLTN